VDTNPKKMSSDPQHCPGHGEERPHFIMFLWLVKEINLKILWELIGVSGKFNFKSAQNVAKFCHHSFKKQNM
jgi:hypothetical protein